MADDAVQKFHAAVSRCEGAKQRFAAVTEAVLAVGRLLTELRDPHAERTTLVHEMSSGASGPSSTHPWPTVREINQAWADVWRAAAAAREAWEGIPPDLRVGLTPPDGG